jgi:hypothetical protein
MTRSMRLRPTLRGRAAALRHVTFLLRDDGSLAVYDGDRIIEEFSSFARALTSYRLRRTDLEPIEVADEWSGLPLRGP